MKLIMRLMSRLGIERGLTCDQVMEVLQAYLDGEVDAAQARAVSLHLDKCDRCNLESDVFRRIQLRLKAQPFDVDPEVSARLEAFGQRLLQDGPS